MYGLNGIYGGIGGSPLFGGYGQPNNGITLDQLRDELAAYGVNNQSAKQTYPQLQPYLNKQNDRAYQALNGGLLGTPKQQGFVAGNAGGTPSSAIGGGLDLPGLLDNFQGFGNRSWMKG